MTLTLVLSLFPGIGLLDRAFEEEGYCVVRGPDVLWGGDVRKFRAPAATFDGVIGGPPCQSHCRTAALNRAIGNRIAEDLVPEFIRCVREARPRWWLMENVPNVPTLEIEGYYGSRFEVNAVQYGSRQDRWRSIQFGADANVTLDLLREQVVFQVAPDERERVVTASEGKGGMPCKIGGVTRYAPRRSWAEVCELMGVPEEFLAEAPFTVAAKYRVLGNGVPMQMGRALARAVKRAMA